MFMAEAGPGLVLEKGSYIYGYNIVGDDVDWLSTPISVQVIGINCSSDNRQTFKKKPYVIF